MHIKWLILLLNFTEEATQILLIYIQNVSKSLSQSALMRNVTKKDLENFLSDLKDEVKLLAIRISKARKSNLVEKKDMQKALRKLAIELFRMKKIFFFYSRQISGDINILKTKFTSLGMLRILDAGCGWGRASRRLSKCLNAKVEVTGIDMDILSLKYGKSVNFNYSFIKADMTHLPFKPRIFNAIVSSRALHEIKDKRKALKEFSYVLKRNGLIYIFDLFAREHIAKLIRFLLHKIFSKTELYSKMSEFESILRANNFRIIRKEKFAWPFFSTSVYGSFIAEYS
jgi:ubiquinone/menaquinone biosynthesis C-methylase UbiE